MASLLWFQPICLALWRVHQSVVNGRVAIIHMYTNKILNAAGTEMERLDSDQLESAVSYQSHDYLHT